MNLTDINEIKALLARSGFRFSKTLGQNFLRAAWVPEKIADAAELNGETGVLEVGPGIGCLTVELSRRAKKVLSSTAVCSRYWRKRCVAVKMWRYFSRMC